MANVIFKQGANVTVTGATLNPAFQEGSLIFATDSGKIYLDIKIDENEIRQELYNDVFRQARMKENKLQFFYTDATLTDTTTADKEVDMVSEQFLDTNYTKFEYSFNKTAFEATMPADATVTYPANVDDYAGKTVLALVMKSTESDKVKVEYSVSLIDLGALIDVNKADKITITAIGADNTEKTANAATHNDEIVTMIVEGTATDGFKGNIKTSGKKFTSAIGIGTTEATATSVEATASNDNVPTELAIAEALYGKADKVGTDKEDEILTADATGNIQASGYKAGGDEMVDAAASPTVDTGKVLATEKAVDAKKANKLTLTTQEVTDGVTLADHENEVVMYAANGDIKSSGMKVATTVRPVDGSDPADDTTLVTEKAVRTALSSAALVWGTF